MGRYLPGDVILVHMSIDDRSSKKIRPAIVVVSGDGRGLTVCPVSSKPAQDSMSIPLSIDDFSEGGLDLFSESYVLLSRLVAINIGEVVGKKGRLSGESFLEIASRVQAPVPPGVGSVRGIRKVRKGT
jgi:mRNA-degrading endonuclease toxin of MazEF toxin-antitoxin module